jgi:hypothetical protein
MTVPREEKYFDLHPAVPAPSVSLISLTGIVFIFKEHVINSQVSLGCAVERCRRGLGRRPGTIEVLSSDLRLIWQKPYCGPVKPDHRRRGHLVHYDLWLATDE